jgi:hypothetical protein
MAHLQTFSSVLSTKKIAYALHLQYDVAYNTRVKEDTSQTNHLVWLRDFRR